MSTEPTIRAAIIEKAARAKFYRAHPEYPAGENHWENVSESYRRMFRDSVTRTLAPVYADIQAEALSPILAAVQEERTTQDSKWGRAHDDQHNVILWAAILRRKVAQAEGADDGEKMIRRFIQVAAVAVAAAEAILRRNELDGGKP